LSYRFLLDTNIISEINKKIPNQFLVEKMNRYRGEVATASTVIHELLYGCLRLPPESSKRAYLEDYIAQIPLKTPVFDYDLKAAQWHAQDKGKAD
jgi:tRNA(fMet)-specific endonuclease VapC